MGNIAAALRRDATVVSFNMGMDRIDEDQPLPPHTGVVEYEDMTNEQKRIVDAGNTIAGSFPQGQTKEALSAWIMRKFLPK